MSACALLILRERVLYLLRITPPSRVLRGSSILSAAVCFSCKQKPGQNSRTVAKWPVFSYFLSCLYSYKIISTKRKLHLMTRRSGPGESAVAKLEAESQNFVRRKRKARKKKMGVYGKSFARRMWLASWWTLSGLILTDY